MFVMENITLKDTEILRLIRHQEIEFREFLSTGRNSNSFRLIRWCNPPMDFVKLNMDGSVHGSSNAGIGGVVRNEVGMWLTGFSSNIGPASPLLAELKALHKGLQIAWEHGFRRIVCESDSLDAVNLVQNAIIPSHQHAGILFSIKDRLALDWNVQVVHTLREGNNCADALAKMGACSGSNILVWEHPPRSVEHLLLMDALGVPALRG